jgi:hypothetical protein
MRHIVLRGKLVASTGNSSMAKVLENLKVFGNENSRTGFQCYMKEVYAKYGVDIKKVKGRHKKKIARRAARKAARAEMLDEIIKLLDI